MIGVLISFGLMAVAFWVADKTGHLEALGMGVVVYVIVLYIAVAMSGKKRK